MGRWEGHSLLRRICAPANIEYEILVVEQPVNFEIAIHSHKEAIVGLARHSKNYERDGVETSGVRAAEMSFGEMRLMGTDVRTHIKGSRRAPGAMCLGTVCTPP